MFVVSVRCVRSRFRSRVSFGFPLVASIVLFSSCFVGLGFSAGSSLSFVCASSGLSVWFVLLWCVASASLFSFAPGRGSLFVFFVCLLCLVSGIDLCLATAVAVSRLPVSVVWPTSRRPDLSSAAQACLCTR